MASKIDHEDLVICPICFEEFKNPKSLPCQHTFCQPCLKSYIITQHGGEGQKAKEFPCPVCRQEVTVTDPKLTSENIADTLPGNHLINSLIDRSAQTSATNEDEKWCGPCCFDDEKSLAVSWCTQCSEPLCENCVKYHRRLRKSKHEIISIDEKKKLKPDDLLDVEEPCMKHTGEVLKVYCVGHKEMCCVICLATSHRKCENVSTFEEIVSNDSDYVENFADCLNEIEKKTDNLRNKTDENLKTLNNKHDEISKKVTTTVQQAKDKLDHLQSSFLTTFKQMHKGESVKLTETKDRIEVFQQNLKKGQKLLKTMREQGSPKQVFITTEKLKMQLKQHMDGLKIELTDACWTDYSLSIDDTITTVLNSLTLVAKVEVGESLGLSTGLEEVSGIVDCFYRQEQKPESRDVMKLEVKKDHTVKSGSVILGGVYLPDGRLVLCCHTNKKLKIYDKTWKFLFKINCVNYRRPRDACLISLSEIIVSFDDGIDKYEIQENAFKEMGKISCKKNPWGLAATKNNIIVGYESEVDVLSMNSKVVRSFSRGGYQSFVAVSLTGNVYYSNGNDIVCKTLDGREVKRFSNPKLRGLLGIAVDKYDNVYVCGYNSNNIYVFSSDGKCSNTLIADIDKPINIGFDSSEKHLYVCTQSDGCHFYSIREKD